MKEGSKLFYQYYKLIDPIYLIPAASGLRLPSLGRHWHWQSYGVWRKCSSNGHQWTSGRLNRLTSVWIEYPAVSLIFPVSDAPYTTTGVIVYYHLVNGGCGCIREVVDISTTSYHYPLLVITRFFYTHQLF